MIDRPSSGMGLDELREEFDWMFEFQSRMAEKIRGDADVHNLVDYVGKLESENVALREKAQRQADELTALRKAIEQRNGEWRPWKRQAERFVAENAKLREQMERLVTLLRNDCDIDASWDGLRGFWLIGLTENGCLMRDRACKAEAENDKLRELVGDMMVAWWACDNERCPRHDKRCEEGKFCAFDECARDLGIEVDE